MNRAGQRSAVIISIKDENFNALNISGTGIAFRSDKFEVGSRCAAKIRLPSEGKVFPVVLEVVAKQKDLCRCYFRGIHEEAENLLHSYILELQKWKIRQNHGHALMQNCHFVLVSRVQKVSEISGVYWNILLNWIDFQMEISHYWRFVGGIKTTKANYLNLFIFFGKRS